MRIEKTSQIAVKKLISELRDDLGTINLKNDLTSKTLLPNSLIGSAVMTNREKIVLCGQDFLKDFLKQKFPMLTFKSKYSDYEFELYYRCFEEYYGYPSCSRCNCYEEGSLSQNCDILNGQVILFWLLECI